ncbi:Uncharacterised protein [Escherichia coli]|jgi:hypothetical protein|nr:Uncharacterised protein [Escherichia coli]SQO37640.1 Uncharacterised protein [Escherichia coli]
MVYRYITYQDNKPLLVIGSVCIFTLELNICSTVEYQNIEPATAINTVLPFFSVSILF